MFNTVNPQIEVFKVIMKDIGSNIPLLVNYTCRFLLGYSKFTLGDVPYLIYHSYETWRFSSKRCRSSIASQGKADPLVSDPRGFDLLNLAATWPRKCGKTLGKIIGTSGNIYLC
jgi:hypothetical protein